MGRVGVKLFSEKLFMGRAGVFLFMNENVYPSNFRNELVDLTQNCAVLNSPNQS